MKKSAVPNRLIHEKSQYLRLHAFNMVDWYPWCPEAFERARAENKPVILSIGCHWCHVMEQECFADDETGNFMNSHFINIKVDREERPDIDQVYMDAVLFIAHNGGWPLNCFLLPDGRPFYGCTYLPANDWLSLLGQIHFLYQHQSADITEMAAKITDAVSKLNHISRNPSDFSIQNINAATARLKMQFDIQNGGLKGSPKFIIPSLWSSVMLLGKYFNDEKVNNHCINTLKAIACGGIHDHLAGGFFRYSVTAGWTIPHFEKMLYDNAQVISLFAFAARLYHLDFFKDIAIKTADFMIGYLSHSDQLLKASIDADSEGKEGNYYTWRKPDIDQILGEHSELFCKVYQITDHGNWESVNILFTHPDIYQTIKQADQDILNACRIKLLNARLKRLLPLIDNKTITSWNALAITGLLDLYFTAADNKWLSLAIEKLDVILNSRLSPDGSILRILYDEKNKIDGFLDDYAFFIEALLKGYQYTADYKYLESAVLIADYVLNHFLHPQYKQFITVKKSDNLLFATHEDIHDQVMVSSGSSLAYSFMCLFALTNDNKYLVFEGQLTDISQQALDYPEYYSNWLKIMFSFLVKPFVININPHLRDQIPVKLSSVAKPFFIKYDQGLAFDKIIVCRHQSCLDPFQDLSEVADYLNKLTYS